MLWCIPLECESFFTQAPSKRLSLEERTLTPSLICSASTIHCWSATHLEHLIPTVVMGIPMAERMDFEDRPAPKRRLLFSFVYSVYFCFYVLGFSGCLVLWYFNVIWFLFVNSRNIEALALIAFYD